MSFPQASNNEAEYEALLHGMKMAKACGATRLKIFGDSNLVVQQVMNRCDTINDNMMAYKNLYHYLEGTFDGCKVLHISRNSNEEADNLMTREPKNILYNSFKVFYLSEALIHVDPLS
jgi:ribonuclease HI